MARKIPQRADADAAPASGREAAEVAALALAVTEPQPGRLIDLPPELRAGASLVVTARQPARRRAGRSFGRHGTVIPLDALSDAEIAAIEDDPVLVVRLRRD